MSTKYETLCKKAGKKFFNSVNDKFGDLRLRYLAYRTRGDSHEEAVNCTWFDFFESDDDFWADDDPRDMTKPMEELLSFLLVFEGQQNLENAQE